MTAMERACEEIRRKMTWQAHDIVKARARKMISGELPMRFCDHAAAVVARWRRRQDETMQERAA